MVLDREEERREREAAQRALLLAVRQALIIATRAIERYLGLGPARGERG